MKIAVTGATGYIGERLIKMAHMYGYEVIALSRVKPNFKISQWIPYEINTQTQVCLPNDVDAVFHLATTLVTELDQVSGLELKAAKSLLDSAENCGAMFVFVSSQTARPDAPTIYGRSKWEIEQEVLSRNGCVIRPGQVYGGVSRALNGKIITIVNALPILPYFYAAPKVQPIHVDDLALGMLKCASTGLAKSANIISLGSPQPISFNKFIGLIASVRLRSRKWGFPLPSFAVRLILLIFPKNRQLQQLRSLFELPEMDTHKDLVRVGLTLRNLESGLNLSGDVRRRDLLVEAKALISYVIQQNCPIYHLRHYVKAIEQLRNAQSMNLPKLFLMFPSGLAIIDRNSRLPEEILTEFKWRLDAAMLIAEAIPINANRFLIINRDRNIFFSVMSISIAILKEFISRILSVMLLSVLKIQFNSKKYYEHRRCL